VSIPEVIKFAKQRVQLILEVIIDIGLLMLGIHKRYSFFGILSKKLSWVQLVKPQYLKTFG